MNQYFKAEDKDKSVPKTRFPAIWALVAHFVITVVITVLMLTLIDGHNFSITTRRTNITEVDGSTTLVNIMPLQTDVTTAISIGQTFLRLASSAWTASTIWHCVFILLKKEGISLKDMSWMLKRHLPARYRGVHSRLVLFIAIILLAAVPANLSSPLLTGSITWVSSHMLVPGTQPVSGISAGGNLFKWNLYQTFNLSSGKFIVESAATLADSTWGNEDTPNSIRRYIPTAGILPVGTVFHNVTVPYFVIDHFEWIQNVTNQTAPPFPARFGGTSDFFPFSDGLNPYAALFPANHTWGPTQSSITSRVISKTQIATILVSQMQYSQNDEYCSISQFFGKIPPGLTPVPYFYPSPPPLPTLIYCYAFANVTFRAGVVTCNQCTLSAPRVLQLPTHLHHIPELQPDPMTEHALQLAPSVAHQMVVGHVSVPSAFENVENFFSEVLSRSYQAAWTAFTSFLQLPSTSLSTSVMIPIPLSQAQITTWRVYLWMLLNLVVTFSGLLFFYVLRQSGQEGVADPEITAILLNSSNIVEDYPNLKIDYLPQLNGEISQEVGLLRLEEIDGHSVLRNVDTKEG